MSEKETPKWYVIHTYSGHENKVKATIEKSIKNRNMEDIILEVSVPMEEVIEVVNGKQKIRPKKIFPGYCLIKMIVTDESWYVVRNTKGVTGFVGPNSRPIALTAEEVENMGLEKESQVNYAMNFVEGEKVLIKDGPFANFQGVITKTNAQKGFVRVTIFTFGDRETLVDLEVSQIKKID
ncbi:MAG: transcription termination/antitermination protein NusG [Filifactoraceae bacterium]